jgi:hypothetical protein
MKKIKGDKSTEIIIHKCMEISQGNSLCSYLFLKQARMSRFSFYLFSVFFYKIGEQEGGYGSCLGGRLAPIGVERWQGKG